MLYDSRRNSLISENIFRGYQNTSKNNPYRKQSGKGVTPPPETSEENMREKLKCAVVGATGMVGQRFLTLLENHPYFQVTGVVASPRTAGKTYEEAVAGRWKMAVPIPEEVRKMSSSIPKTSTK